MNFSKKHKTIKGLCVFSLAIIMMFSLVACGTTPSTTQNTNEALNGEVPSGPLTDEQAQEILDSVEGFSSDIHDEKNEVEDFIVGDNHRYVGQHVSMEITGMEEFESLKSNIHEDVPAEGNVFVVFYIDMCNIDGTEIYFSPDYCEFDVDGTNTGTTILVNEPREGYETIFGYVNPVKNGTYYDRRGFMVIEAPKDWQNITFRYTGWRYDGLGNIIVINNFTRNDLHSPE